MAKRSLTQRLEPVADSSVEGLSSGGLAFGAPFTDYLVLQRERRVPIWGHGRPGETVTLHFAGQRHSSRVDTQGRWLIRFNPGAAWGRGRPLRLTSSGGARIELRDVVVGDVWFCAGQSNMEMGLAAVQDGPLEAARAKQPGLRLLLVPKTSAPVPQTDLAAQWRVCTPETVIEGGWGGFSAVAYHFARRVGAVTRVPMGLIQAAYGGSKIHPFIHPEALHGSELLEGFRQEKAAADRAWQRALSIPGAGAGVKAHPFANCTEWNTMKASMAWNAMIHPLLPFSVRGALWYQGESNVVDGAAYTAQMAALLRGFRLGFEDARLPVFFAQIAPWTYGASEDLLEFWRAQYRAARLPQSGMVTTVDLGDLVDIHPIHKKPVGERFAALALNRVYGHEDQPEGGPRLVSVRFSSETARLRFRVTVSLRTTGGGEPTGFELAGHDGIFHPARASLVGDRLTLRCPEVPEPSRVRHAWRVGYTPNLTDSSDIPALPFVHPEEG